MRQTRSSTTATANGSNLKSLPMKEASVTESAGDRFLPRSKQQKKADEMLNLRWFNLQDFLAAVLQQKESITSSDLDQFLKENAKNGTILRKRCLAFKLNFQEFKLDLFVECICEMGSSFTLTHLRFLLNDCAMNGSIVVVSPSALPAVPVARSGALLSTKRKTAVKGIDWSDFDMKSFFKGIRDQDDSFDATELALLLANCAKSSSVLSFSKVDHNHLRQLGMIIQTVEFLPNSVEQANKSDSPANKFIDAELVKRVLRHFCLSKEAGCRILIDHFILFAMEYAQSLIDKDDNLRDSIVQRTSIDQPHVAAFPEMSVPETQVSSTNAATAYTFHGYLDYGICFIHARQISDLSRGFPQLPSLAKALSGVVEAKTREELTAASPQICTQIMAILQQSGKKVYTGALTTGSLWRFFFGRLVDDKVNIFHTEVFEMGTDNGIIVELLKDMVTTTISPLIKFA